MSKQLRFAVILKIRTIQLSMADTNAMVAASMTILGTIICQWHGTSAEKLNVVLEYFDGKMEATFIITYGKRTIYSLITTDFFILITMNLPLPNVLVMYIKMHYIVKLIKDSYSTFPNS